MNFIFPIILFITSLGIFFGYVDPNFKGAGDITVGDYSTYGVKQLQEELAKYQGISQGAQTIVTQQKGLVEKRNLISSTNQQRLERMLPSNVDNIRLIIEISGIANNRNLTARNLVAEDARNVPGQTIGGTTSYGTLALRFSVNASYQNFLAFLADLENNLRLVDITGITFTATESGFYDFNVTLNTYWLK